MKQKILAFIVHNRKFLALKSKPHPQHGGGFWFVVTGEVEEGEDYVDAAKREIIEETGLNVEDLLFLNWGSIYEWRGEIYKELNFISFVNSEDVTLNEEHDEYEWLDMDVFIERIKWDDDKELLRKVLKEALNKKKYFKRQKIKDYRENEAETGKDAANKQV